MNSARENINFKEQNIKLAGSKEINFKNAVGAFINENLSHCSDVADSALNVDVDDANSKDLIEFSIESRIGRLRKANNALNAEIKQYKGDIKNSRKEIKLIDESIKSLREENIRVHKEFDEKNAVYQDLKAKFKKGGFADGFEKQAKKNELKQAKDEGKEAYIRVQDSNWRLDYQGTVREKIEEKQLSSKASKANAKSDVKTNENKIAALKVILDSKKELQNTEGGSAEDLTAAGKRGLTGAILNVINPVYYAKSKITTWLMGLVAHIGSSVMSFILPLMVVILIMSSALCGLGRICHSIIGFATDYAGGTEYSSTLSDSQVQELILDRGWEWQYDYDRYGNRIESSARRVSTLPYQQQVLLWYAFSKVGYPYSQEYRTSGAYFDCSSLAYYTEASIGKDITCYAAATQAKKLYTSGKALANGASMQIGDLIYYGGHDNGRYLGIYHVAIYVGNGYCVEAFNTQRGVIYAPVRTKNSVMICRP